MKNKISISDPYDVWGLILIIIGVLFGGLIGGGISAIVGLGIINVGRRKMLDSKKILINIIITFIGVFAYFIFITLLSYVL